MVRVRWPRGLWRHRRTALPALLKTALHHLAATTQPAPLRHVLQAVQQFACRGFLLVVGEPDFGQALVRRQLASDAPEKIPLHAGGKACLLQGIRPERCNGNVGGAGEAKHVAVYYLIDSAVRPLLLG